MKTAKLRKGKNVDAPKKNNASAGCTGVKKSTSRTSGRHQKATGRYEDILTKEDPGVLPSSAAQVLAQQLPNISKFCLGTTEEVPASEVKTGQLHPSAKIKLQLFPIDEGTRIGLEKDGHNPFLELTLRARKKISSVLKHINTKWGSSSVALGEPMLFPYSVLLENRATDRRWTLNDTSICAEDVYAAIKSPAIFRLRYGWFSNFEPQIFGVPSTSAPSEACLESEGIQKCCSANSELMYGQRKKLDVTSEESGKPINISEAADSVVNEQMSLDVPVDHMDDEVKIDNGLVQSVEPWDHSLTNLSIGGLLSEASIQGKIDNCDSKSNRSKSGLQPIPLISDISIGGLLSEASLQGKINNRESTSNGSKLGLQPTVDGGLSLSPFPWDDSLTTLSIGGLLSEASLQGKINNYDVKSSGSKSGLQPTLLISESFDAFIASQLNSHPHASKPSSHHSHSSILDAEETCHAFPFRKFSSSGKDVMALDGRASSGGCGNDASSKSFEFPNFAELNNKAGIAQDPHQESKTDYLPQRGVYNEDSSPGLAGIKWNDSLGPFHLGPSALQPVASGDSISISEFVR